ncbi:uncharacterized protein LOC130629867 [Hydractinia symbiolongicarpus]|uniref:uncharacterized protein LOC130629867 n=1 Tax=Hydractinia symbiolongicarpus TaxID=13093 RepID=UPI00254AD07A|nr:uncharacterized protein LOC130629867 [Hydractinia symbiolongicarpus]
MIQLQTFLTETEAVLNSRPLVYIGEELNDGTTITPAHFLSPNTKTGTPQLGTEEEIVDPDYQENITSKDILLKTWKKGQNILESFWKTWRNDYLLNLRERSQINLKARRIKSYDEPNVGSVVQIKKDLPRGSWKIAKITELIPNSDGKIRAARILLPNKNIITQPSNLLYPLECNNEETETKNETVETSNETNNKNLEEINTFKRTPRIAAIQIHEYLTRRVTFSRNNFLEQSNIVLSFVMIYSQRTNLSVIVSLKVLCLVLFYDYEITKQQAVVIRLV